MTNRCLYCYKVLDADEADFHKMISAHHAWIDMIAISFLSQEFKDEFIQLLKTQIEKIS